MKNLVKQSSIFVLLLLLLNANTQLRVWQSLIVEFGDI